MLNTKLLSGTASAPAVYVDDVFSTYLYAGNSTTQTITNGIDLSGKGGLVWVKSRSFSNTNYLVDTVRGATIRLVSESINGEATDAEGINLFNSNGFRVGNNGPVNDTGQTYCSWTFREQPKFFDVVTYTGTGSNRTIAHNLGSVPGMIIVKRLEGGPWYTYHRSTGATQYLQLNETAEAFGSTFLWNNTTPTSSVFTVGTESGVNASGGSFVAYLFAHDAGGFGAAGTDNVISCGSYVGTGDGAGNNITLGFEPQFVFVKNSSAPSDWRIIDAIRGTGNAGLGAAQLSPNTTATETGTDGCWFTPTGFTLTSINTDWNTSGNTYIYMAIRRPMKPPTSGAQVFSPTVYTGTNADNRLVDTGIVTDMVWARQRNSTASSNIGLVVGDRLRGNPYLRTGTTVGLDTSPTQNTDADSLMTPTAGYGNSFSAMNGFGVGNDVTSLVNSNTTSNNHIALAFKRASKFFDVVCYTGTGSNTTITHNLNAAPEMLFIKRRNAASKWAVYANNDPTDFLHLNRPDATADDNTYWNDTNPTSTNFSIGTNSNVNSSAALYVAYLFATLAGISKVGTYTGNGSNQTINCGFTAGARFVLIKRIDAADTDWFVWDTARGIVSGNDPYLRPNLGVEITDNDSIDPDSAGFIVNQIAATNINVSSATYIFLAIA